MSLFYRRFFAFGAAFGGAFGAAFGAGFGAGFGLSFAASYLERDLVVIIWIYSFCFVSRGTLPLSTKLRYFGVVITECFNSAANLILSCSEYVILFSGLIL